MPRDLNNDFMYHAPKGTQPERYKQLRAKALEFANLVVDNTPDCREASIALTKIEEATMWANAAIARNEG